MIDWAHTAVAVVSIGGLICALIVLIAVAVSIIHIWGDYDK